MISPVPLNLFAAVAFPTSKTSSSVPCRPRLVLPAPRHSCCFSIFCQRHRGFDLSTCLVLISADVHINTHHEMAINESAIRATRSANLERPSTQADGRPALRLEGYASVLSHVSAEGQKCLCLSEKKTQEETQTRRGQNVAQVVAVWHRIDIEISCAKTRGPGGTLQRRNDNDERAPVGGRGRGRCKGQTGARVPLIHEHTCRPLLSRTGSPSTASHRPSNPTRPPSTYPRAHLQSGTPEIGPLSRLLSFSSSASPLISLIPLIRTLGLSSRD